MEKKCVRYVEGSVVDPWIALVDRYHCVIADGSGHITVYDLMSQQVLSQSFVGATEGLACCNLRSLCVERIKNRLIATATKGGYAVLCNMDEQTGQQVCTQHGGTVNAVAFSPGGEYLAIGTGFYPLSGMRQPAHLEIWALDGNVPEFLAYSALPGVCVDAITWSSDGDRIACVTGLVTQDRSFIAQLDASSLRPSSFIETDWIWARRVAYIDLDGIASHLAVVLRGTFRMLQSIDGKESWQRELSQSPDVLTDFAYDPDAEQVLLTSGDILSPFDGEKQDAFMFMKDCTSIALRPGGGLVGVSSRGRICTWG